MYRVIVTTNGKTYPLHDVRDEELILISPKLDLEVGKTGAFSFRISPKHPFKDKILPLTSEITVFDGADEIYCGRSIGDESDFYNIGRVTCEGELAYLLDSIQRPYTFTGSQVDFIKNAISIHNSQVEERKYFYVGNITVPDTESEVIRACDTCENTLMTIKKQCVEMNGGYLKVRKVDGKKYLDYVSDYGGINGQTIRFGENLLDFTKTKDPTAIITALIPYGGEMESEETEEKKRVDITTVNGGLDYIINQSAIDTYGWIFGSKTFDSVADPEILLLKAREYLNESILMPETLELNAVDLGLIHVDVQKLKLGYWTSIVSKPHEINKRMLLSKRIIHLDDPRKDMVVLGTVIPMFTADVSNNQTQISDKIDRIAASTSKEIIRKIQNATNLITGGTGGYLVIDIYDPETGKKKHPWRMLIMDTPDQSTAKNVWQFNMNGLGFSRTGINGPYENAWTIDGNLIADFITAGTMLADRIRGGVLELGGTGIGKDGRLVIKNDKDVEIGYWDKTGLYVLKGVIKGSEFIGGMIDIGDGTFKVDNDGSIIIKSGEIIIGPIHVNESYVDIGGFRITDEAFGAIISTDTDHTIGIYSSEEQNFENGPAIVLNHNGYTTRIGRGGIATGDISLKDLDTEYDESWGSVSKNIIELWKRLIDLENLI